MARTCLFSYSLLQMRMGGCVCAVSFCPTRDDVCDVSSRTRLGTQPGDASRLETKTRLLNKSCPLRGCGGLLFRAGCSTLALSCQAHQHVGAIADAQERAEAPPLDTSPVSRESRAK